MPLGARSEVAKPHILASDAVGAQTPTAKPQAQGTSALQQERKALFGLVACANNDSARQSANSGDKDYICVRFVSSDNVVP
jgi:hypothetical protein